MRSLAMKQFLKKWRQRLRLDRIPDWFAFVFGLAVGAVAGLVATGGISTALIGFLGVVLGGTIPAITNLSSAEAARRVHLAAAIWPKRVEAHQKAFSLWCDITPVLDPRDETRKREKLNDAMEWWKCNCMYLSNDARNDFQGILAKAANLHLQPGQETKFWEAYFRVGRILIEGAEGRISDKVLREVRADQRPP